MDKVQRFRPIATLLYHRFRRDSPFVGPEKERAAAFEAAPPFAREAVLAYIECALAALDRPVQTMPRQFLGVTARRWIEYLIAILLGNAIYYFSLVPHLPILMRHQGFHIDLGVAVDFAVCVAVYGLIWIGSRL